MAFVKLDCGILRSTLWMESDARTIFITALLMAEPEQVKEPIEAYEVRDLTLSGFIVPPGWYGKVQAAGIGIIRQAMVDRENGLVALELLASPDLESRSREFDGRRMVRVDGGFIILNFYKYRNKDHTSAVRSKRYREKRKSEDMAKL